MDRISDERQKLADFQRRRRLTIFVLLAALASLLVFGRSSQGEVVHDRIEAYGIVLIMIGIGGRLWSILYVGGRKSRQLVTTGPYSITRNPLYFFSSIAAAGVGAQMGSYLATICFGVLCAVAFHVVIRREEEFLTDAMGDAYAEYLVEVPRFFPAPRLYRDEQEVTFQPRVLRQTLLDGLVFFVSVPAFEIIEMAQESGTIPILFTLP